MSMWLQARALMTNNVTNLFIVLLDMEEICAVTFPLLFMLACNLLHPDPE